MHINDAMSFIEMVFCDFAEKKYGTQNITETEMNTCLEIIRLFVNDEDSYWVKEKAVSVVDDLLNFDDNHAQLPSVITDAVACILKKVASELTDGGSKASVKNPSFFGFE